MYIWNVSRLLFYMLTSYLAPGVFVAEVSLPEYAKSAVVLVDHFPAIRSEPRALEYLVSKW